MAATGAHRKQKPRISESDLRWRMIGKVGSQQAQAATIYSQLPSGEGSRTTEERARTAPRHDLASFATETNLIGVQLGQHTRKFQRPSGAACP